MQLSPYDLNLHSKLLIENATWNPEKCIVLTVSFTPGSCTLTSYKLSLQGYEWGKKNKDLNQSQGFSSAFYEKVQLFLSDRFLGYFMCPDNGIWNYNFVGLGLVPNMKFALILQNPKEFYNEAHRV